MIRDDRTFANRTIYWLENDPGDRANANTQRNSVTDEEGDILQAAATGLRVLEIGTGTGYSAERMLATAKTFATVDIDPFVWEVVWPRLTGATLLKAFPKEGQYDLIFIDGAHSFTAVTADLGMAQAVLADGGTIICHDLHLPGAGRAIRSFAADMGWDLEPYRTNQGLCKLSRKI